METVIIILTGVLIIASVIWFYRINQTVFHPFVFIGLICFLVQVIGPLDWKIIGQRNYRGIPIMDYIIQAEFVFCLGYVFYWIFYVFSQPLHKEPVGTVIRQEDSIGIDIDERVCFLFYGVCFALYAYYMQMKGRSLISQLTLGQIGTYYEDTSGDSSLVFLAISINMLITTACLLLYVSRSSLKYVIYALTIMLTITSGRRHLMLDIVVAPIMVYYLKNRKKPNIFILTIIAIICFMLVGWIGAMRSVYRYGQGSLVAYDNDDAWAAIMINLEVFMPLCIYIPNLKSISDYSLGSSYITAVLQLIPRIVFPHKDKVIAFFDWGKYQRALGRQLLREGIAGTFWSLLYANGWIYGVIIGMSLLGRWVKLLEIKPGIGRISYLVEYSIITTFMFQFMTRSFGNALQDLLGLLLPLFVLRRVCFPSSEVSSDIGHRYKYLR